MNTLGIRLVGLINTLVITWILTLAGPLTVSAAGVCVCDSQGNCNPNPCFDAVTGCPGECSMAHPNICYGGNSTCKDGTKGSPGGADAAGQMAQQMMQMLQQAMQKAGGGSGGGSPPSSPTDQPQQPTLGQTLLDSAQSVASGSTSPGSAFTSISDLLFGVSNTPPAVTATGASTTAASNTGATSTPAPAQNDFPTVGGGVLNNNTLIATGTNENTGFGSFFGGAATAGQTFVGKICTARPWQTSFVTQIFSPTFFDTLCERIGFAPGTTTPTTPEPVVVQSKGATLTCPRAVHSGDPVTLEWHCAVGGYSGGTGFSTNGDTIGKTTITAGTSTQVFTVNCTRGGSASCTTLVIAPRAQITAQPQRVPLSSRAKIYWAATDVASCDVTGPGFHETGLRGAATTGSILDSATFTIICTAPGGETVTEHTTVDVGN